MRWWLLGLLAALSGLLAACVTSKPAPVAPPAHLTLFFTADLQGTIAPCGCAENMLGGIAKTALQIEKARTADTTVAYFDVGNGLFNTAFVPDDAVPQQERKARALGEAMTKMGLTARWPGPLDDARGPGLRHALELPELKPGLITRALGRWTSRGGLRRVINRRSPKPRHQGARRWRGVHHRARRHVLRPRGLRGEWSAR